LVIAYSQAIVYLKEEGLIDQLLVKYKKKNSQAIVYLKEEGLIDQLLVKY
jgi:hypothetical protein